MARQAPVRYIPQVPEGWEKCPRWGDPRFFDGLNIIPCKVPLGDKFNKLVRSSARWTLAMAIQELRSKGLEVGTVIDLTKSRHYYDFWQEMETLHLPPDAINYVKIECRGRGESPQPAEVNQAVWHIYMHMLYDSGRYILLHCTHGFNRTGFVAVAALMRLRRAKGMTVRRALRAFASSRAPGIYKDHYINDLFKYYHEARDHQRTLTPAVPAWKGSEDAEDAADAANEDAAGEEGGAGEAGEAAPAGPVTSHEDIWSIGERVCAEEANWVKQQVVQLLAFDSSGRGPARFPGMQPVSLAMDGLHNLTTNRYWATWKADGTRYMVLLMPQGTYLMDRSFNVVRVEMRWPCGQHRPPPGKKLQYLVGKPHELTLLDGEMVLDHDPLGKMPPRLRYLIYDCCMINGRPLISDPYQTRFKATESDVVKPRASERAFIDAWRGRPFDPQRAECLSEPYQYDYAAERFSVRRKDFWPVWQIDKVFRAFGDHRRVGHESDGLILQGADHPYTAGTCELLYKWKFAHMNSVDFLLRCATVPGPDGQPVLDAANPRALSLQLLDQSRSRGERIVYIPLEKVDQEGHFQVEFPEGVDPLQFDGKLIECTFDRQRGLWTYMRPRIDKDTPNANRVYLKIKDSILHHVDQSLLVGTLKEALMHAEPYKVDRLLMPPDVAAAVQRDVAAWEEEQAHQRMAAAALPPPPPLYHPEDMHGDAHAQSPHDDTYDNGGGQGGYRVSEAEPAGHEGGEGEREGEGGGVVHARWTLWDLEPSQPDDRCPGYEGFGWD